MAPTPLHAQRSDPPWLRCLGTGLKYGTAHSSLALPLAILLVGSSLIFGGDSAAERETLRGLKAIKVAVEGSTPDLERQGLTREELQSGIEEQLRKAGINIDGSSNEFLGQELISGRLREGPVNLVNLVTVCVQSRRVSGRYGQSE